MMAGVDAQLRMLLLLLQTLFALSQTAAPTTEVYICPGLSSDEAHSYSSKDPHQLQAESADGCMCSKTGTTVVSQGTRLLLLCVSEEKLGETKQCLWTLGHSPDTKINNRSDITGQTFDGKLGLWEDKRCSFNGNISADDIWKYTCYHEVPSANHRANGFWKCSIKDQNGLTTSSTLLPPRLKVKARCESNGNCDRARGEVCDSQTHYCRHACEGTGGGTATCHRTISNHSHCRANQSSNSGYSCRCSEGTVPIYSEQGNLTNCMRSCSNHTQCKEDEKCVVQSGAVCNQPHDTPCSDGQKICSHVCNDIRCGENQLCQPKTAMSHEGECVCSLGEYVALPDGKHCVKPYLRYTKLNIGLYLKGRSLESPDKFEDYSKAYSTSVTDAFGAKNFTMFRRETVRIICSLKAGYPYPTVNWTLREPSQYPGVLHQVKYWNTDYKNKSKDPARPVPKYAEDAFAQISVRNLTALPSGRSGSNNIYLTCTGKHVNLAKKNPGGFLEAAIKLIVKDCTQDEDCLEREKCNNHECQDVSVTLSTEGNPCRGANEKCVSSQNHSFECHCKEGFARDNKQSACLKTCANPSNCNMLNRETCSKGLCRDVCQVLPCGHGTNCMADNNGGRSCNCQDHSLYKYNATSCFPTVTADVKHLRVRVRNQDLLCESEEYSADSLNCYMPESEPGNSTWNITIFFGHLFPKPDVEGLLVDDARLQQRTFKHGCVHVPMIASLAGLSVVILILLVALSVLLTIVRRQRENEDDGRIFADVNGHEPCCCWFRIANYLGRTRPTIVHVTNMDAAAPCATRGRGDSALAVPYIIGQQRACPIPDDGGYMELDGRIKEGKKEGVLAQGSSACCSTQANADSNAAAADNTYEEIGGRRPTSTDVYADVVGALVDENHYAS